MRTIVITGATDGIGRELGLASLQRGDSVLFIGKSEQKGAAILERCRTIGVEARAHFIQADLSLIAENKRVIDTIAARTQTVDALVMGARFFRSVRTVTSEGLECTIALYYLSRYLLGHRLLPLLERAAAPVIINLAGPQEKLGAVPWGDLQLARNYSGMLALKHGGQLCDLLGLAFPIVHPDARTRYVLFHPGTVLTSFAGEYDESMVAAMESLRGIAKPVAESIRPIIELIDRPPSDALSAFAAPYSLESRRTGLQRVSIEDVSWDRGAAKRLHDTTLQLLAPLEAA